MDPEPDHQARAAAAAAVLQQWYRPSRGLWRTAGWWNAASALTALIACARRAGFPACDDVIATTFRRARLRHRDFVNSYYDDNGWWALAWLDAGDLTGDPRYYGAAAVIFERNLEAWDDHCGGGLWWSTARRYKNAITAELFLVLAARLAQRAPRGTHDYKGWALRTWDWFAGSGMIGPDGLVNDGLTADCANNGDTTWTYNQGVILGGLAALHQLTGDGAYLAQGRVIADAAITRLASPEGILTEPHEALTSPRDGDRPQFKGVFARYLHDFCVASPSPEYTSFILRNARTAWDRNRNASGQFGLRWSGPFDRADACRQSAALDLLNAAAGLAAAG